MYLSFVHDLSIVASEGKDMPPSRQAAPPVRGEVHIAPDYLPLNGYSRTEAGIHTHNQLGFNGWLRPAEIGRRMHGITQRMLTRRFRHLERDGLVSASLLR
ncbi:winged helix-turn-helix transcriptional regulator [Stenotrophomonas sp. SXG-1]